MKQKKNNIRYNIRKRRKTKKMKKYFAKFSTGNILYSRLKKKKQYSKIGFYKLTAPTNKKKRFVVVWNK
jgi:hypothetical protein